MIDNQQKILRGTNMRIIILRALSRVRYFKGRDKIISAISDTFKTKSVRIDGSLRMILDPYEWIQQEIILKGCIEPITTDLIQRLLSAGDVFVDVGAHVGHHSLIAAQAVGAAGVVIAIDPQPYNADRIGQNALLNGMSQIEVLNAAALDKDSFDSFPFQTARDRARFAISGSPNDTLVFFNCPVRRLDGILTCRKIRKVRVLKIDVEGFEFQVLKGLGERISDCDHIIFENLPGHGKEAVGLLQDHGFKLRSVNGNPFDPNGSLPEGNVWAEASK